MHTYTPPSSYTIHIHIYTHIYNTYSYTQKAHILSKYNQGTQSFPHFSSLHLGEIPRVNLYGQYSFVVITLIECHDYSSTSNTICWNSSGVTMGPQQQGRPRQKWAQKSLFSRSGFGGPFLTSCRSAKFEVMPMWISICIHDMVGDHEDYK